MLLEHHITASATVCAALPHALAFELSTHPIVVADGAWLLPDFFHDPDPPGRRLDIPARSEPAPGRTSAGPSPRARQDRGLARAQLAWLYRTWVAKQARAASLAAAGLTALGHRCRPNHGAPGRHHAPVSLGAVDRTHTHFRVGPSFRTGGVAGLPPRVIDTSGMKVKLSGQLGLAEKEPAFLAQDGSLGRLTKRQK